MRAHHKPQAPPEYTPEASNRSSFVALSRGLSPAAMLHPAFNLIIDVCAQFLRPSD